MQRFRIFMAVLRDYQKDICSRIDGAWANCRSVMAQMPTGTGKTVVLASIIDGELKAAGRGGVYSVLIVAHRRELVEQISRTVTRFVGSRPRLLGRIHVKSIQWLSRNISSLDFVPSLVVVDEAHHALAKTYRMLWEAWPKARFLGLTATPYRLNGVGFTDLFDTLVCSLTVPEFMQKGVLATFDYVSIRPDSSQQRLVDSLSKRGADGDYQVKEMDGLLNRLSSIEGLYRSYLEYGERRKGIIYAISIEHAARIAGYYSSHGVAAVAISSRTSAAERARLIDEFRGGGIDVLVNVDIFSEGFDCPDVEVIQLARPTLSLAKYLQMVGRGLRPCRGKKCCTIIDTVGLHRLFGLPTKCWDWEVFFRGCGKLKGASSVGERGKAASLRESGGKAVAGSDMEVVVSHEKLDDLLTRSMLDLWSEAGGVLEEKADPFKDGATGLWGLRRGGVVLSEPRYLRVFDHLGDLMAVRLKDASLAVVRTSGELVRKIGRGQGVRFLDEDFLEVVVSGDSRIYVDIPYGTDYFFRPRKMMISWAEVLVFGDRMCFRLKDRFDYGVFYSAGGHVVDYGFYMLVNNVGGMPMRRTFESVAADLSCLCLLRCDNERAYWIVDIHEDGSIDVVDRRCLFYHVTEDGGKTPLDRNMMMEKSMALLNLIDSRHPARECKDPEEAKGIKLTIRNMEVTSLIAQKRREYVKKTGKDGRLLRN